MVIGSSGRQGEQVVFTVASVGPYTLSRLRPLVAHRFTTSEVQTSPLTMSSRTDGRSTSMVDSMVGTVDRMVACCSLSSRPTSLPIRTTSEFPTIRVAPWANAIQVSSTEPSKVGEKP